MTSYIDHQRRIGVAQGVFANETVHSWREHTRINLAQQYGQKRADAILAGRDAATQADLQRWANLGRRSAA
jgi:hypothetical protein